MNNNLPAGLEYPFDFIFQPPLQTAIGYGAIGTFLVCTDMDFRVGNAFQLDIAAVISDLRQEMLGDHRLQVLFIEFHNDP